MTDHNVYVTIREPRLPEAVACAMLFAQRGWSMEDPSLHICFEDIATPEARRDLPSIGRNGILLGLSVPSQMAHHLGVEAMIAYDALTNAFNHELQTHSWQRGGVFDLDARDGEGEVPMSLSYMWAAPYLYGITPGRYEVLRDLMGVASRLIWFHVGKRNWDLTRKGADFAELFPLFAEAQRMPFTVPGCAKVDFFRGRAVEDVQLFVALWLERFFRIRATMRATCERMAHDLPKVHMVEGRLRLNVRYLWIQSHFDVPALFEVSNSDIVIAHSQAANCTGIFTRHDLDLHAGMRMIHETLNAREPGAWTLLPNPDGDTPRLVSGTLGRMAEVPSTLGADENAMIAILREVAQRQPGCQQ